MSIEIRDIPRERGFDVMVPLSTVFGVPMTTERADRFLALPELEYLSGACEGDTIVGSAGAFTFEVTVPGGAGVETSGLTIVAVLPTHRRRGILRQMMRRHLDQAHRRGQVLAALFASEGGIYGRFGYGMAALRGEVELRRDRTAFRPGPAASGEARVRIVGEQEAAATFPAIWDRVRPSRPGMLSRSPTWWRVRRLSDPEWVRAGRPPLQRALLTLDGRPRGYAVYRLGATVTANNHEIPVDVVEAIGDSPEATRAIWRYLMEMDIVTSFRGSLFPPDHPLLFLLAEPSRLHLRLADGLWARLVDVGAALSRRRYGDGQPVVIEVSDAFCPWNEGRYRVGGGAVDRTSAEPDLSADVDALGAAYLGGFGFTQLAQTGRVVERTPGALARADALFRGDLQPWCPEIF